jgi:hypothetical protein
MNPSDTTGFVVVYQYRYWDAEKSQMTVAPEMATLDAIKDGLGIPMSETGTKVGRSEVDERGRLKRPLRTFAPSEARSDK